MKPVGSLKLIGNAYAIRCEPYVRVRIKRIFSRVEKAAKDVIFLRDTDEMAHELLWFMERYPLTVEGPILVHMQKRRESFLARQTMIEQVLGDGYEPRRFELALPPRNYQAVATDLYLRSGALLVADEVGLGKTLIAIASFTEPAALPALVVTLTHLPIQWEREIHRFAPALRVHRLRSGRPSDLKPVDVIISNYHKLPGWAEVLAGKVNSVVFDEVQELRTGGDTAKYKAARTLCNAARYKLGLSATPIYNYGDEMFNILDALQKDCLGGGYEFGREWCSGHYWGKGAKIAEPKAFGRYLRDAGLMIRRTRHDVQRELPAVTRIPHHIEADLEPLEKVHTTATELAKVILSANPLARGERWKASEELSWRLRQATGIAKAPFVAAFVRILVESGEKVVLFGWHHEVYKLWGEMLDDLNPAFYTGEESPAQKEHARLAFLDDAPDAAKVLIMSLRAGAGLDGLQAACRTVVFGELDWSPGVHEQCVGRIHRDGQKDPVMAYFLVTDVGADPVIADVLGLKTAQSEGVRDPEADLVEALQVDENHVRKLAEAYLKQRARPVEQASLVE